MLYHREVYWKELFDAESQLLLKGNILISNHLYKHIEQNTKPRYNIDIDKLFDTIEYLQDNKFYPFEVETDNGKVTKAVVRVKYDNKRDISIVIRKGFIVTAWLNDNTDLHFTLDESKYYKSLDK